MTNKKFNILMILLSIIFIFVAIYMLVLINKNEKSQIFFQSKEFINTEYSKDDNQFYATKDNLTLVIDGNTIYNEREYELDEKTGELIIEEDEHILYLRSITEDKIILWYNKREIHFDRVIELK